MATDCETPTSAFGITVVDEIAAVARWQDVDPKAGQIAAPKGKRLILGSRPLNDSFGQFRHFKPPKKLTKNFEKLHFIAINPQKRLTKYSPRERKQWVVLAYHGEAQFSIK
jgi:hypothetical protein